MKELGLQTISVASIDFGDRLRQVDENHAALLAQNIEQVGRLRTPIEVRKKKGRKDGYLLIAGGHRLRAVQLLGWAEVQAFVFEATDEEARLAEIDENLVRHDLNPLDRAVFMAEREDLYRKMHPEATQGGDRRSEEFQIRTVRIWSFARDTAERCGLSEDTIQRALKIGSLKPDVRARIAGTWLAHKQGELLKLTHLSHAEQHTALDLLLAEGAEAKTVEQAKKIILGVRDGDKGETDKKFDKLIDAWRRADRTAKRAFLAHLRETGQLDEFLGAEKEAA